MLAKSALQQKEQKLLNKRQPIIKKHTKKLLIYLLLISGQMGLTTLYFYISEKLNWQNPGFLSNY